MGGFRHFSSEMGRPKHSKQDYKKITESKLKDILDMAVEGPKKEAFKESADDAFSNFIKIEKKKQEKLRKKEEKMNRIKAKKAEKELAKLKMSENQSDPDYENKVMSILD